MTKSTLTVPSGLSLNSLTAAVQNNERRPVDTWNPAYCGSIDMRIASDGTWFYLGTPINRPAMVKLFASILRREADGSYVLVTPVEKVGITVDDAPFAAIDMTCQGIEQSRQIIFRLNTGHDVTVGADHPIRVSIDAVTQAPRPYVMVRGGMEALISRVVFYELIALADAECSGSMRFGLWSSGAFFALDGS
jgi:uncharacterized protein